MTKNLKVIPELSIKFINVVRQCWFLLLHPEHLILQPPQIQVTPEIVYKTVQNEQGVLQNPTGWFVLSSKGGNLGSFFFHYVFIFFMLGLVQCHCSVSESSLPSSSLLPLHKKKPHTYRHRHCNAAYWCPNMSEQNLKTHNEYCFELKKIPKFHIQNFLSVCHVQVQQKRFHSNELINEFVYRWTETRTVLCLLL